MQVDLSKIDNLENFRIKEFEFQGTSKLWKLYLVNPNKMNPGWTKDNLIFRSSIWTEDGRPVSLSYPKFFNWGEQSELYPEPTKTIGTKLVEKVDGSALILSWWDGKPIVRTRGSEQVSGDFVNVEDITDLKNKYPKAFAPIKPRNSTCSFIYEWTSELRPIVIRHEITDMYLTGIISHEDYSLLNQDVLDQAASEMGVKRPRTLHFFKGTLEASLENIRDWEGTEGVCVYYDDDQLIKKVKTQWYLLRHRMLSDLSSDESIIDYYLENGRPDFQELMALLQKEYDHEIMQEVLGPISKICNAYQEVKKILASWNKIVDEKIRPMATRKEQALYITSSWGKTARTGYLFKILDNKEMDDRDIKKLIFQVLNSRKK